MFKVINQCHVYAYGFIVEGRFTVLCRVFLTITFFKPEMVPGRFAPRAFPQLVLSPPRPVFPVKFQVKSFVPLTYEKMRV